MLPEPLTALDADTKVFPGKNVVVTRVNVNRRPVDMIYVIESDDLTTLGHTVELIFSYLSRRTRVFCIHRCFILWRVASIRTPHRSS